MASSYRLLTYAAKDGPRAGIYVDGKVYDAEAAIASQAKKAKKKLGFRTDNTLAIVRNWSKAAPLIAAIAKSGGKGLKGQALGKVKLKAPIDAGMIWCAGANYYDHVREMTGHEMDKSKVEPFFFIKSGGPAAVIGEGDTIKLPAFSKQIDWEAELAVVIGRPARNVKAADALKYVAGYTILNDLSARDRGTREDWVFRFDWLRQKSFDTCCPMGPWIVPASEIADPQKLKIDLWIGNSYEQDTNTDQMVFTVAEQIEALSKQVTLWPGDVITTGTGAGCGRPKGKYMKPGDRVKITIEKIGTLNNRVAQGVLAAMKAMLFREFGGPEVLHFEDIPTPEPKPGEVLVKVHYVTVNITLDVLLRKGGYYRKPPLPHILGCDPIGEVAAVGKGVRKPKVGTRVMVHVSIPSEKRKPGHESEDSGPDTMIGIHRWGGYAEYVAVPAGNCFALPKNLSDQDACVIMRHLPTARHQLHSVAKLKRGEWVLVMGAAGGLASCVIQVAKRMGAKVIGAAGSDDRVQRGLEFGADFGVNYRTFDLTAEVKSLTGGQGVHVVAENVGDAELFPKALKSLRNRGRLVTAGAHATGSANIDLRFFYLNRIRMFGEPGCDFPDIEWSLEQCKSGGIKPPLVERVMGLSEAPEAHRLIEARAVSGKILLDATR